MSVMIGQSGLRAVSIAVSAKRRSRSVVISCEAAAAAEIQCQRIVRDIRKRGDKIIGRGKKAYAGPDRSATSS